MIRDLERLDNMFAVNKHACICFARVAGQTGRKRLGWVAGSKETAAEGLQPRPLLTWLVMLYLIKAVLVAAKGNGKCTQYPECHFMCLCLKVKAQVLPILTKLFRPARSQELLQGQGVQ